MIAAARPPAIFQPAHRYEGFLVDALHLSDRRSTIRRRVSRKSPVYIRFRRREARPEEEKGAGMFSRVAMESVEPELSPF